MVEIDEYLRGAGRPIDCLINIHDAIDYQFAPEHRHHYEKCLDIMVDFSPGGLIELDVPMKVDAGEGPSWDIATYGPEVEKESKAA
jgi:DNA polymerase I-like protein with 3'-5' exonuclease and polymerase domains